MADKGRSHWIFLRGLVRESAHWDNFPTEFAKQIPGAQLHLLDLPGNGIHFKTSSPLNLTEAMELVRNEALQILRVKRLHENEPVFLFSISLGSMVAIEWLQRHPSEIQGAVLINTSLRSLSPLYHRLAWRAWLPIGRILFSTDVAKRERRILELTAPKKSSNAAILQSRVSAHEARPIQRRNFFRQLWAAARYWPSLEKPSVPLLLLSSLGDELVDPRCGEALSLKWKVEREAHPTAGHDLPLEEPEWTLEKVKAWFASLRPTS